MTGGSAPFRRNRGAPWKNEPRARPVSRDSYCIFPSPSLPFPPPPPPPPDCGTTRCCFDDRPTDRWRVYDLRSNSLRQMRDILCRVATWRLLLPVSGCDFCADRETSALRQLLSFSRALFLFFSFANLASRVSVTRTCVNGARSRRAPIPRES